MKSIAEAILKKDTSTLDSPIEKYKVCLDQPNLLEKVEGTTLCFSDGAFKRENVITIDFDRWEEMGLPKQFTIEGVGDNYGRQRIRPISKKKSVEGYNIYKSLGNLLICLPKGGFQIKNSKFGEGVYVVPEYEDGDDFLIAGVINEDTKEVTKKILTKNPVDTYTPRPKSGVQFLFGIKFEITEENYRLNGKYLGKFVDWMDYEYNMMYLGVGKIHTFGESPYDPKKYPYTYDLYDLT